jgi:hypothetical protein
MALALAVLVTSDAVATTARFLGPLRIRYQGRADDGTRVGFDEEIEAVADGTGGDVFTLSRRLPSLAEIPLLGALFSRRSDRRAKLGSATGLFVLITPTLVTEDEPLELRATAKRPAPIPPPGIVPGETTLAGAFKVNGTFQRATLKGKLTFEGVVQTGPLAGRTVKGKLKLRFAGDRL